MRLFKLLSTYELVATDQVVERPVRIEVFCSIAEQNIYRARVWVRNNYNVYPASVNTGKQGQNLQSIHSSDEFNQDISTLVAEDEKFFEGAYFDTEELFFRSVLSRIELFFDGEVK